MSRSDTPGGLRAADEAKQDVRERVWADLQAAGAARFPGTRGRIPNFVGAEAAARLLATEPQWMGAATIKANPDSPQLPVRAAALAEGKLVYMAVPRLSSHKPFHLLDPGALTVAPRAAASIRGAARHGASVAVDAIGHIDLVVCGTVAVNAQGVRVGKGGGYSDLELALLVERGSIDDQTVIATTVHPVQVVEGDLPETAHDFRVDLVITPREVLRCPRSPRPPGILWDHLDGEKVASIPALAALADPERRD